ncbi:hypothetical protein Amsp01_088660 [Amycolatopsis sp. NBRC 101858]|uniref:hypothetical protein n=1 Tax=Amycolatopsis sp. NBRC 101858 TaxID=3032200 RepID=UPI0024A2A381|nr:hypothetical protein [Amycolatopsis sp. NBRC 101858]GLY42843.1 hypothetical protein Amsp01_088660 [Amycolatopsis sp. NBRC 101858]
MVLLRGIEAVGRDVRMRVQLDLCDAFGGRSMWGLDDHGVWTARTGDLRGRWTDATDARPDGRLSFEVTVAGGTHHDLVLEIGGHSPPGPEDAKKLWAATEHSWQQAVPPLEDTIDPRDAYAVLRGLTAPTAG